MQLIYKKGELYGHDTVYGFILSLMISQTIKIFWKRLHIKAFDQSIWRHEQQFKGVSKTQLRISLIYGKFFFLFVKTPP